MRGDGKGDLTSPFFSHVAGCGGSRGAAGICRRQTCKVESAARAGAPRSGAGGSGSHRAMSFSVTASREGGVVTVPSRYL